MVARIAEESGLTKKDAGIFLDTFQDVVVTEVAAGNKVSMVGFCSFERIERAARNGRNPQTGKPIKIKATKAPKVKLGKTFKEIVAGS